MAKEAGESVKDPKKNETKDETAAIRGEIERTRGNMASTVNQIEERLSPAHIKEQIADVTASVTSNVEKKVAELKDSVIGGYHETKDHLKEDLGREVSDARHKVSDEITNARHALREATVGRVEHMVHDARDTVTETGSSILETVKANPIPAALIGIGLGWLIFGSRSGSSRGRNAGALRGRSGTYGGDRYYYGQGYDDDRYQNSLADAPRRVLRQGQRVVGNAMHTVQDTATHLGHSAQGAVHDAGEAVSHLAHDAGDRVAHVAELARDRGQQVARDAGRQVIRAERSVEGLLRENPLAVGAVTLAIGAAIGMSLPSTRVEDEWMGETKERLLHEAEHLAGAAIHKAEDTVAQLTSGEGGESGGAKAPERQETGSAKAPANGIGTDQTKNGPSSSKFA